LGTIIEGKGKTRKEAWKEGRKTTKQRGRDIQTRSTHHERY